MTRRVAGRTPAAGALRWAVVALLAASAGCATGTPPPGAGGAGGAGGSGGAASGCSSASDCPAPSQPCGVATCNQGVCGVEQAPEGTVVAKDVPANCHALVCDATGQTITGIDVTNVPVSSNPCVAGTCDQAGAPATAPVEVGTPCASAEGGQKCDGAGNCVECLVDGDCPQGKTCNILNSCAGSPCMDGVVDGNETDVDCGGGTCPACGPNKACKVGSDCETGACDAIMHTCLGPNCSNQQKDGNETDVDCGGACAGCALGEVCGASQDCASQACDAQSLTCVADPCDNHQKDGQETDVDCGGFSCGPCAAGKTCVSGLDCTSGICDPSNKCASDPCTDGVVSGAESDVDCGGGACPGCGLGKTCFLNFDCASNACDGLAAVCVADQCNDNHKDGTETDVDCGGPNACARCTAGNKCVSSSDCITGTTCSSGNPKICL